jgi:AraC-like DNA-binding protein
MGHLHDSALSIATVSQALHISQSHIHRVFESEVQTFNAWLQSWRLLNCKRALENEAQAHRSITEIAFGNGFRSSSHFSRAFRHKFGMSPSECRDSHTSSRPE